jgi:hypothetical protein
MIEVHRWILQQTKVNIMSGTLVLVLVVIALIFVLPVLTRGGSSGGQSRGSRRNQDQADQLISQAEMQVQTGQLDSAASLYSRAAMLAVGDPILMSEAHYGLFRVAEKRRDLTGALRQIDAALSYAPEWRAYKPNFEGLLQREKDRVLAELGQK